MSQFSGGLSKKSLPTTNIARRPNPILQTPQADSFRKIDEYTERSKNIIHKASQIQLHPANSKPIVSGWVKNVRVNLQLNEDKRHNSGNMYNNIGQLSQRGINDKNYRSVSNVKTPLRNVKTQGSGIKPLDLPPTGQGKKMEQLRQIVVSQGSRVNNRRCMSDALDSFKTPVKGNVPLGQNDPLSLRVDKAHRKVELSNRFIRNMSSLYTSPQQILPLSSNIKHTPMRDPLTNGGFTERGIVINNPQDLEVRTVDKEKDGTSLGLPDDSNYYRLASFMEDLKQSIEIPYRKIVPARILNNAVPQMAIQNYTIGKSKSMKSFKRVVMDRTRTIESHHKRCVTPNDLHLTGLVTRPSAFSTSSSPQRDRSGKHRQDKPKIASVVLHPIIKNSADKNLTNYMTSIYSSPNDAFPDDVNLNNTKVENSEASAGITVDQKPHDFSTQNEKYKPNIQTEEFMRQLNTKLQNVMKMRCASEKYLTNVSSVIPQKPYAGIKPDPQKFRLARKLYTKGNELVTYLTTENKAHDHKIQKESTSTIKEEEEINDKNHSSASPTNKLQEGNSSDKNSGNEKNNNEVQSQSASVSVSKIDLSDLKDWMHIQNGESLLLFPVLKVMLPFGNFKLAVNENLQSSYNISWKIPVPMSM